MRRRPTVALVAGFLFAVLLVGCGGSDGSSASADKGVADADGRVPFSVLGEAIMKGNKRDYDAAAEYFEPDGPMLEDGFGKAIPPEQVWNGFTRGGTVKTVDKTSESYTGQSVSVAYVLHFSNGESMDAHANFVKVDDRWKIRRLNNDGRGF